VSLFYSNWMSLHREAGGAGLGIQRWALVHRDKERRSEDKGERGASAKVLLNVVAKEDVTNSLIIYNL